MKKDMPNPELNITEQELLDLLQQFQRNTDTNADQSDAQAEDLFGKDPEEVFPDPPDVSKNTFEDIPLIFGFEQAEQPVPAEETLQPAVVPKPEPLLKESEQPKEKAPKPNRTKSRFFTFFFPCKGDPAIEILRKSVMLLSIAALLISAGCLAYFMVLEPQQVTIKNDYFESLYIDKAGNEDTKNAYDYPAGMQSSFRQLYDINKDIAGWLSYVSTDAETFMDIRLPIVHCDNNDKYLSTAFDGTPSRSGTLFFESSNNLSQNAHEKVHIVYGHNMASGQMFASLNKLYDSVYRARSATTLTLDTLYETYYYKVFAVIVCDENAAEDKRFGYLRNSFADDADFINYVNELRARSLYDYPVEVNADDQLLILSTCTNPSQVLVQNGRLAVIARRVRADEMVSMDTTHIAQNTDVIMPYAWYTLQKKKPHPFYTDPNYHLPEDSVITATTTTTTTRSTQETLPTKTTVVPTPSTSGTTTTTTRGITTSSTTITISTQTTTTTDTTTTTIDNTKPQGG